MADRNEDDLEDVDGLTIADRREKWAREGDFENLWKVLVENSWSMIDQAECFRLLLQAMEVAARNNPRQFSATMFAKMMGFTSYLLLRTHFHLEALLDRHDPCLRTAGSLPVPREIIEAQPSLIQLQEHVAAMAEAQARAARMWGLAGKTRRGQADAKTPDEGKPVGPTDALPFRVALPPGDQAVQA